MEESYEFLPYEGNEYIYIYIYNNVNLKNALEFVDLVFKNNLDRIYFLKQYIKDFEINYGYEETKYVKKLTK